MYRVFAISLTSILMLMNVLGPAQPAMAMDDTSADVAPVMDQVPDDDGGDVVLADDPVIEEPEGEDAPVDTGKEELTSEEAPEETANSPPADEQPVVEDDTLVNDEAQVDEEAPVTNDDAPLSDDDAVVEDEAPAKTNEPVVEKQEPVVDEQKPNTVESTESSDESGEKLISPSAVDPKPGECPVGEICDGGGGEELPAEVNVSMVSYTGTYYFPNAVFTIADGTTTKTLTADAYGWVSTKLTSGVTYSVSVQASGFGTQTPVSITPTESNSTFSFELTQIVPEKYTVTIEVIDAKTQQPLADAEVRLVVDRTWSSADSGTTNGDGMWTSKELVEGKYWASVSHDEDVYHGAYDIEVNLPASGTIQIQLQRISKSPISLKFIDASTSEPIAGVFFALAKEGHGTDLEDYSGPNGEYTTSSLEHGNYGLFAWMDGYGHVIDYRWNHPHNGSVVIELQPIGDGTVTIHAIDAESGDPIPDAMITIFDANAIEAATGKTGADGKWTSPVLPGGYYVGKVYPVRHYWASSEISIVSGNTTVVVETWEYNDVGYLWTNVIDITQGTAVSKTKVTVREFGGGVMAVGFTDDEGVWIMPQLPAGHYEVTFQRAGYYSQTVDLKKTDADTFINIELHRPGQFKFRFWLRYPKCDCGGGDRVLRPAVPGMSTANGLMPVSFQTADEFDPIVGATARLIDPLTMEIVAEATSDDSGFVDFGAVYEGSYTLQITGPGFQDYSQDVEISGDLEFNFVAEPSNPDDDTDPDTGDGDDDDTPTNPVPGDGDDGDNTPTNPGDDDNTPTNPGDGDDDDSTPTNPVPGDSDNNDTSPGVDDGSDSVAGEGNAEATTGSAGNEVAQASSSGTSDTSAQSQSGSVSQLPVTGTGVNQSGLAATATMLLAGVLLLSAAFLRRRA